MGLDCLLWIAVLYFWLIHGRGISADISRVSILCDKAALCPLFPLSIVFVWRMGQESMAAVVVSVGSAFPKLTTAYSFKSTETRTQTKPLMTAGRDASNSPHVLVSVFTCKCSNINHPTVTSPNPKRQLKPTNHYRRVGPLPSPPFILLALQKKSQLCCHSIWILKQSHRHAFFSIIQRDISKRWERNWAYRKNFIQLVSVCKKENLLREKGLWWDFP